MFVIDGVAYAGEPVEVLGVLSADYAGNSVMLVTFSTGETRLFDATALFNLPAFAPLSDESVLADFSIDHGILTWLDGDIDIDTEYLYEHSIKYERVA